MSLSPQCEPEWHPFVDSQHFDLPRAGDVRTRGVPAQGCTVFIDFLLLAQTGVIRGRQPGCTQV